jgi:RNA polymerase sigma factor (sigma-70 family)
MPTLLAEDAPAHPTDHPHDAGPTARLRGRSDPRRPATAEPIAVLFERVRSRTPGALPELIRRCEPLVRSAAHRHLGRGVDVDDVVQEVWVALIRHLDRISSADALGGWLWVVATHAAIRQGKSAARLCPQGGEPHGDFGASWPDDDAATRLGVMGRQCVRDALDRLKPKDRLLIELLFASERPSYQAISHSVGRPIGSIGPTRQRLLNRLREDPVIRSLR